MNEQIFFGTEKILRNLNPEQKKAVECLEGPLLVMAGAGSGKTRVLTHRIANLVAQGVSPFNILAITFTNKAANEMKSRAEDLIGSPANNIILSTFHSFCARLLRREIKITGEFNSNFAIFDAGDSKNLIKRCVTELELDEKIFDGIQFKISSLKDNLITPKMFREKLSFDGNAFEINAAQIYELYQKKLQENNALDFDDLIFKTVEIFKTYPDVLEKYQDRFQYISVDEYQDTSVSQYVLTKLLAAKYRNICVVGDADQSIYGWRGADMRNILNFERDYPEARVILLEQNYRSTKTILNAANAVISNNFDRKPKNLWTKNESGEKIKFIDCETDIWEALTVAREIKRLVAQENFSYNDIALLYRTNAQSRLFEERFMKFEIPYIIVGGLKFYDRKEIKDILAYLHVIANPHDDLHLLRIVNTPRRGLGSTGMNKIAEIASINDSSIMKLVSNKRTLAQIPLSPRFRAGIENFAAMMISFMESAKNLPVDELIITILEESGYIQMIRDGIAEGKQENVSREENLGTFVDSAKEFVEMNPNGTLQDFLNHVALITDLDTVEEEESRVKLMTVHTAKGLEFPVVFLVGMEDGIFPHASSFVDIAELEEERRACYVALTRAKKKLYITAADERMYFGKMREQKISRFIEEIPDDCVESLGIKSKPPQKDNFVPEPVYNPPTAHRAAKLIKPAEKKSPVNVNFHVGDNVRHKKWGLGTVMLVDGDKITVSFSNPEIGTKILTKKSPAINKF